MMHAPGLPMPNDPIAIVGIGCSLPGGVDSPESLWEFLRRGGDGVVDVPPDRWNIDAVYDPRPGVPGKTVSRRAGLLCDVGLFDAPFFGISPREAAVMDPQQRLLLEVTWRALEDAGIPAEELAGSNTGVYIGVSQSDYQGIQRFGRGQIDIHTATGGALSIAANRLSHRFDLRGPSLAIDTACSSSLVALDAACSALLNGQCDATLVGGVNIMLAPDVTLTFSRASMLSPDGRCKAFDARANGYVRGEGAGIVVLKLLSRALSDGDRIHAVIRATFVNQDGNTSTITVPSRDAQIAMLTQACAKASLSPACIGYVEAHGTGTAVGDPIEAHAIGNVFGKGRAPDDACLIGSIKTNIGHLEPAAGIAGVIKAALCVQRGEIPPSLHFETPNPHIDFAALGLRVASDLTPWRPGDVRIAAVNSFGFGGTNACAIIEEPPQPTKVPSARTSEDRHPVLVPVSAASKTALATVCTRLADTIEARPLEFSDVAGSLALRRSHLEHRLVVIARSAHEAVQTLRETTQGSASPQIVAGRRSNRRLAFVFTGQGSQWWGMGRGLLQEDPLFRDTIEQCDRLFAQQSGWSLIEQLMQSEDASRINETIFAQPAIFALQVALAGRLAAWGVRPQMVIGHSIGEIAAAHVAGALTLSQAVAVVHHRSRLQERARLQGGMAAIGLAADSARAYLETFDGQLEVAAINGPELVSIAGPRGLLDQFVAKIKDERKDVLCQVLRVDYAFHSWQMDPFTEELRDSLADLRPRALDIPMFSSVTGEAIAGERLDADYWCRNMRQPVLFKPAVDQAIDAGIDAFLELGAHPSLLGPIRACLAEREHDGLAIATLRRDRADADAMAHAAASLHVHGVPIDWTALAPSNWKFVDLFGYPWEKQFHWAESEESRAARFDGPVHPLLGYRLKATGAIWHCEIDANSPRYLDDHRIEGVVVFPAAAYVELMLAAARETLGSGACEVEAITFHEALFLEADNATLIETSVEEVRGMIRVHSRDRGDNATWILRAAGRIRRWSGSGVPIERWAPKIEPPVHVGRARFYRDLAKEGHTFGAMFQGIESLRYAEGWSLGTIVLPDAITDASRYVFHPVLLDNCLQVIRGFRGFGGEARSGAGLAFPVEIGRLRLFRQPTGTIFARANVVTDTATEIVASIAIVDDTGRLVATIDGFRCLRVVKSDEKPRDVAAGYYRECWTALPKVAATSAVIPDLTGSWLILADPGGLGESLARSIVAGGGHATLVFDARHDRRVGADRHESTGSAASLSRIVAAMDRAPTQIVHLWGLAEGSRLTAAGLVHARRLGVEGMVALVQALAGQSVKPRLWAVTAGASHQVGTAEPGGSALHACMAGFLRSLANEQPDFRPTLIDLDPEAIAAESLLDEICAKHDTETEVALRGGERFGLRLEPFTEDAFPARTRGWDAATRTPPFRVTMSAPGTIENLTLSAMDCPDPRAGEVAIEVHAVGLNFRDVMAATGLLPAEAEPEPAWQRLGFECAGTISDVGDDVDRGLIGRRVVAVAPGCMASRVCVSTDRIFPIPRKLSFSAAAAIPVAFATAHYALVTLGRLRRGERILIHAAAGGVGLAAVGIAQALGAEVLATAGSHDKRSHLYRLGVAHVFDSRSLAFADEVLWKTDGRGVDVVLNSLPGPFLEKSLSVLAPGGRFLEIGKRDIYADTPVGLHAMRNNAAFFAIDLAKIAADQPHVLRAEVEGVLRELARGQLGMMPVTSVPVSRVADAFRRMLESKHIGKIVVSFDDKDASICEQKTGRLPLTPDATYLVTGGTGGFGLETACWLVDNGARSLVLVGRSRTPSAEAEQAIADLRSAGAAVSLVAADVGTRDGAAAALAAAAGSGRPLRGVIHAAGVIDDALIADLDSDRIDRVFAGKVMGAWHLHEFTQSLPLDFFVLYSSLAAALGSPGQAHYAAANRVLDAIAALRRKRGLPAASIAFGPIGDRGYLTRREDVARYIEGVGIQPMPAATALTALGTALRHAAADFAFAEVEWSRLSRSFALVASSPRTSGLAHAAASADGGADRKARSLILAAPEDERRGIVTEYLHRRIATVLKLEPSLVEVERPLHELGLDSLTAFELKNRIETELGVTLPVGQFLQRPTISALVPAVMATMHGDTRPVADAVESDDFGPAMSFGQEALWFIDRLDPGNPAYGLVACVSFRPHLDEEFLDQNVQKILLYNEHLRFAFPSDGIGPVPKLLPPERYRLIRHDATGLSETAFSRLLQAEANRPFDLAEGPLNRLHLFRRSDRDVLLLQFHHIVADAASIALLMDEVFEGYFALQAGLPLPPPRQRAGFGRFVAWQRALIAGPQGASHRAFWREQLAGAPPSLPLSTDHPRPTNPLGPGAARSFKVTNVVVEELKGLARAEGTTLFSVLLTALNVLLHRHSGARDIVVGTPMSGRTRPEFEEMVGYLVNALPIRTQISGGESFGGILAKVDATVRAALEHQDYPFPMIVRDVEPAREPGSFPIFQIMFGMERFHSTDRRGYAATLLNMAGPAIKERGYTVESVTVERNRAPFDLSFTIEEFNDQSFGVVDYRRDLWDEETIARLVDDYQTILHQVVASPFCTVTEFVLDQDGAKPLCGRELQDRPDILTSLCAAAAARPDAIALSDVAGDLAYGALLDRVARVAGALTERALGRGARVGICLGRSRDLPIAMLAALSSGAAYVPLDPSYPRQRLAAIIADASPDIVIADRASAAALPGGVPLLLTDDLANAGPAVSPVAAQADDLAYVIHTSGSTGQPAGVEIERGALANFLAAMRAELPLSPADTLLAVTPYSFDIAALELLLPLTIGGRVVIAEGAVARDGRLLAERIERGDVTILQATPATWQMLIDAGWRGSRHITALCGGEALPSALAAKIVGRVGTLFNLYGPTETTVWSTFAQITDRSRTVPIGRPLANTTCLVVDAALRPVGPGVAGELLIGGAGLARGYRNDPVRTAERFISDPLDPEGRRRVFRTGDFVRRRADGSLQFLGRRDSQVKVRGFRIELGEVEAQLRSHSAVRDAVVVAVGDDLLDRRLAAFAVVDPDLPADAGGLTAHLRERLPYYMVPDIVRVVAAVPRLPNGKIDRGRLTALAQVPVLQETEERQRTPVEMQLAAVLEELLGLDRVGLDDNFFSLGGTSLLAMRYVTRVNDVYNVRLGAADMVRAPTVASMAQLVADHLTRGVPARMDDPESPTDARIGSKLWRPLAMTRAEGSFDQIDAAAIVYLPDDLLKLARRTGAERALRRHLPAADDPQWSAVCHLPAGTIALVVVPRFGIDLIADQESTVRAVDAAAHYALRLGAKTVSLTGLIPAMTDLGRALPAREGLTITTGHATTASAVLMTLRAAARAGGRAVSDETIAFVGLGAIGSATLRLMLDREIIPRSLILCDVPAKRAELERLADEARRAFATRGDVEIVCAGDRLADEVYGSRFIVGATNAPGLLDIARLRPGTIVVDDSFPHCFDTADAIQRMSVRSDVLLLDGGFVSPPGTLQWQMTLPMNVATVLSDHAEAALLPDSRAITGCILSSLLLKAAGAVATIGPVDVATCRDHWLALERMGIGAAPLRCEHWSPSEAYLENFRTQFGRAGG